MATRAPDPAPTPAPSDDDLHWFEAVGGDPAASTPETADARTLRQLLAREQPPSAAPVAADPATLAVLLERLAQAGADEDRAWFEAIGGAASDSQAAREGSALRGALAPGAARSAAPASDARADTQAELLRRLAELQAPAVPARPAPAPSPRKPAPAASVGWLERVQRWLGLSPGFGASGLALAAMLVLAVAIGVLLDRPPAEEEVLRQEAGRPRVGPGGSLIFSVREPEAQARAFAKAMADHGVPAQVELQGELWTVRAALPETRSDSLSQLLAQYHIVAPPDGLLEVVFARSR